MNFDLLTSFPNIRTLPPFQWNYWHIIISKEQPDDPYSEGICHSRAQWHNMCTEELSTVVWNYSVFPCKIYACNLLYHVGFVLVQVPLEQIFLRVLSLPLSVSLHQCSTCTLYVVSLPPMVRNLTINSTVNTNTYLCFSSIRKNISLNNINPLVFQNRETVLFSAR